MCIALGCVEKEVQDACTSDMLRFGGHVSEDDARGDLLTSPCYSSSSKIVFA